MILTVILLLLCICRVFLMLFAGVALIQDKKYFSSAPKDVKAAIRPREERFHGAYALGWILMAAAAVLILIIRSLTLTTVTHTFKKMVSIRTLGYIIVLMNF